MSDLFNRILADKKQYRKHLGGRSFREKVAILEKLRDRSVMLSQHPLRNPPSGVLKVEVSGKEISVRAGPSKQTVYFQSPARSSISQNSATVSGILKGQSEHWQLTHSPKD